MLRFTVTKEELSIERNKSFLSIYTFIIQFAILSKFYRFTFAHPA